MATIQTLEIDLNFFLTEKGKEALAAFKDWKNRQQEDGTLAKLRESLASDGLIAKKVSGKLNDRIRKVFQKQDGLNLEAITEGVNAILEEEGKGETASLKTVKASLNFSCTDQYESEEVDGKKVKTEKVKSEGWLDVDDGYYSKKRKATKPR